MMKTALLADGAECGNFPIRYALQGAARIGDKGFPTKDGCFSFALRHRQDAECLV